VIRISRQTDGINAQRIVAIAIYCRPATGCNGSATMSFAGQQVSVGSGEFSLPGDATSHLPIRVTPGLLGLIRKHDGVNAKLAAVVEGKTFTQTISVKIL
jgi:hypothetical protein